MARTSFVPLIILFTSFLLVAQSSLQPEMGNAKVEGYVRSATGVPIANASILVRKLRTGDTLFAGMTASDGSFTAVGLPEGDYEVVASKGRLQSSAWVQTDSTVQVTLDTPPGECTHGDHFVSVHDMRAPEIARKALEKGERALIKKDLVTAERELEKAIKQFPEYAEALTMLAAIEADRSPQRAQELAARAIAADPASALAHLVLAATLNDTHQLTDGLRQAEEAVRYAPTMWQAHFERGRSLAGMGQLSEALACMDRADELSGKQIYKLASVRSQLLAMLSRHAEARGALQQWLQSNPRSPERAQAQDALSALDKLAKK